MPFHFIVHPKLTSYLTFLQQSVVNDLQAGKRVIFAVGPVNSKMTLFISGPNGKSDVASGCTVQVDESKDGIFKITNPLAKMPNGVSSADVIFVCADSSGSKLVTMSSSSVDAIDLPDGESVPVKMKPSDLSLCFEDGSIHLSSNKSLYYWTFGSSGKMKHFHFNQESIMSSSSCNLESVPSKLCVNDEKIVIKDGCKGSVIPNLVSGYVSNTTAYLFDTTSSVYVFNASAFTDGQSVDLAKVGSKEAWTVSTSSNSSKCALTSSHIISNPFLPLSPFHPRHNSQQQWTSRWRWLAMAQPAPSLLDPPLLRRSHRLALLSALRLLLRPEDAPKHGHYHQLADGGQWLPDRWKAGRWHLSSPPDH